MDANRKRAKVHMLPTEDKSQIWGWRLGLAFMKNPSKPVKGAEGLPYHLYFTTDEEIKEGDWYLDVLKTGFPTVHKCGNSLPFTAPKIIATTDPKLGTLNEEGLKGMEELHVLQPYSKAPKSWYNYLPQPSQTFINCEQGGIDEVDVEYEYHKVWDKRTEELLEKYFTLKLDLRGLITIHHIVQKMYIGIVKYKNTKEREEQPRIGHHTTSSLKFILKWEQQTEKLDHVDYCQVYKLLNQNKEDE